MPKVNPFVGDRVIVIHNGKEREAVYTEYMNGSAFGFLVEGNFVVDVTYWKYRE